MNAIDRFLNKLTIYRLVVYALSIIAALGVIFSFMGKLAATPSELVISAALLIASAYVVDRGFGRLFNTPTNMESSLITALILFLIVQPEDSLTTCLTLVLAGGISSASKFLVAYHSKHIFNPAALAAAVLSLTGLQATTWWIGSSVFWPFSLLLGLAIVRKIRRVPLFVTFVVVSATLQSILIVHGHQVLVSNMKQALLASPLIFLGTVMLTEPATMPPRRNLQVIFAALVATLYVTAWKLGPLTIYPEVALLIGNVFAFAVSPKFKIGMQLKEIQKISDRVYNYVFEPDRQFTFLPGQYMEWTLAGVPYDSRGNRRTFTIASSPTESDVQLGLKYYEPASMYKATFDKLQLGDTIYASQLAGNFTLQGNEAKKLAFIAGGIGITPFRSMIKYLSDKKAAVDIVLLYVVNDPNEFAYAQQLKAATSIGLKVVPIVTKSSYNAAGVVSAKLSASLIEQTIPDYAERLFYVSGPNSMVDAIKRFLHDLHISSQNIKTDHFTGY